MAAEPNPALALLKDIHAAPAVDWWPPAPGWWLLAALLLLLLIWLGMKFLAYWRRLQLRRETLLQLQALNDNAGRNPRALIAAVNQLLKQVAIARFGRDRVGKLYGTFWLTFLDNHPPAKQQSAPGVLGHGPYQPPDKLVGSDEDAVALVRWAQAWVKAYV